MPELDPTKCQFVKRDKQCKAYPVKGTDRCYAHTFHNQNYPVRNEMEGNKVIGIYLKNGEYIDTELYSSGYFFSVPKRLHEKEIASYIGPEGIAVFSSLSSHVRRSLKDGTVPAPCAFPEIETIANETGMNVQRVRRAIKKLEECNILLVIHRWRDKDSGFSFPYQTERCEQTSNNYYVISSDDWEPPE